MLELLLPKQNVFLTLLLGLYSVRASGVLLVFYFNRMLNLFCRSCHLFWFYPCCPLFYVASLWPFSMEFRLIFRDHGRVGCVRFLCVLGNAYEMILSFWPTDETWCDLFIWQQARKEANGKYLKGKRERRYSWR